MLRIMYIIVFVTVSDRETGKKIAQVLLERRLCACVNIVKGIESFFWWQDKINREIEDLLVIKTREVLFDKLRAAVIENHSYDTPEIISVPIQQISQKYADWLDSQTMHE